MASLELDPASGRYRVRFRYSGQAFKRSTRTKNYRLALALLGQVEETLRLLELGMAEVPPRVDPGDFIVSGARARKERLTSSPVRTLSDLFRVYKDELPAGAKEERTLEGERLHTQHLLRHLRPATVVGTLSAGAVQRYVELRSKDKYRGKFVGPDTIKKEIATLRLVWNWAVKQGYLQTAAPLDRLVYPKRDEKPPFMTMGEIERRIAQGSLTKAQQTVLWESLYLTQDEVDALLSHVQRTPCEPFVYPMIVLAAHTGMRRSELLRVETTDLDFASRTVLVREKKRSRKHGLSFRRVPLTGLLEQVLADHVASLPVARFVLNRPHEPALSEDTATHHFKAVLRKSRWATVRGFHVLRHSFASNAAAGGIDERMIDEWMGHQTEEMRRRYRHLAPSRQREAIDTVYHQGDQVAYA